MSLTNSPFIFLFFSSTYPQMMEYHISSTKTIMFKLAFTFLLSLARETNVLAQNSRRNMARRRSRRLSHDTSKTTTSSEGDSVKSSKSSSKYTVAPKHYLTLSNETVHWGYFSKNLAPALTIDSGDIVEVEMASHHSCDDYDKMVLGDAGMESVFNWTSSAKYEDYRGKTGGGDGVHVLTGPIYVNGAVEGDIISVDILDLYPRLNPMNETYGSNAAAWWGFHTLSNKVDGTAWQGGPDTTGTANDEVVTVYKFVCDGKSSKSGSKSSSGSKSGDYCSGSKSGSYYGKSGSYYGKSGSYYGKSAKAYMEPVYQFGWPQITDPDDVTYNYIAYPGLCVPHDTRTSTNVTTAGKF